MSTTASKIRQIYNIRFGALIESLQDKKIGHNSKLMRDILDSVAEQCIDFINRNSDFDDAEILEEHLRIALRKHANTRNAIVWALRRGEDPYHTRDDQ